MNIILPYTVGRRQKLKKILMAFFRPPDVVLSYLIGLLDGPLDALSYNPPYRL